MTTKSDTSQTGRITPIPNHLADSKEYANKFPLDSSVQFLDIPFGFSLALEVLGVSLVRDLFIKKYTYQRLNRESPMTIAGDINKALKKKGLPSLSSKHPDTPIYSFFNPSKRSALMSIHIKVLSDCHWGNIPPAVMAREISDDRQTQSASGVVSGKKYTEDDIKQLINEGLAILLDQ